MKWIWIAFFLGGCVNFQNPNNKCTLPFFSGDVFSEKDYVQVFKDDFLNNTIASSGESGVINWWANMHTSFGQTKFVAFHHPSGVYDISAGFLNLKLRFFDDKWLGGIVQSQNKEGNGYAYENAYFEARMKFPVGKGVWPAFWLISDDYMPVLDKTRAEIDIVEAYGLSKTHHSSLHLWRSQKKPGLPDEIWKTDCPTHLKTTLFDNEFHTFGALLTETHIVVYVDRREVKRFQRPPEFRRSFHMLIDLVAFDSQFLERDKEYSLIVDYVAVWTKKDRREF